MYLPTSQYEHLSTFSNIRRLLCLDKFVHLSMCTCTKVQYKYYMEKKC